VSAPAARYAAQELRDFAAAIFTAEGVPADRAGVMAEVLVASDLMGHTTHGLSLMPKYLDDVRSGIMRLQGEPRVLSDRGACIAWDAEGLPGGWLTMQALELAMERVKTHGSVSIAIGGCHHIGCLAVYPVIAAERGLMAILASSAPGATSVAPFGGRQGALAPDPIAAAWPTGGTPVVVDISASITTNNMSLRLIKEGRRFGHQWLLDAEGNPSDDPNVVFNGGTILPAGGLDHGQKGYGWGLLNEALTQGLSGYGRVQKPAGMLASVFLQVFDPEAFAGLDAFNSQTGFTADACRASAPRPGFDAVRLPGEKGLALREEALTTGVPVADAILEALRAPAAKHGIAVPDAMPALNAA
jgi:L-lactate dehydrogenase